VLARMYEVLDAGQTAAAIEAPRERVGHAHEVGRLAYLALRETSSVYNPAYSVPGLADNSPLVVAQ
jgi:hypothetical protein